MATGVLYFADLNDNSGITWTDPNNVVGQYNVATAVTTDFTGEQQGGGNLTSPNNLPTGITAFLVRFWDTGGDHVNDVVSFSIYNPHTAAIEDLFSYTAFNRLPTSSSGVSSFTFALQARFNAATDKLAFLQGLRVMWRSAAGANDGINISTRGVYLEYEYTSPTKEFTIGGALGALREFTADAYIVDRITKTTTLGAVLESPAPAPPRPIGYDPDFGTPAHHSFIVAVGHKNVYFGEF